MLPYQQVQNYSLNLLEEYSLPPNTLRRCDVCQIVHLLIKHNLNLAFEGDSVTRQTFAGLECELRRRNYNVTQTYAESVERSGPFRYQWRSTTELIITTNSSDSDSSSSTTTIRYFEFYRPEVVSIQKLIQQYKIDILVFDHGLHYVAKRDMERFKNETMAMLHSLQMNVPLLIWRETSAQHFLATGGHYYGGVTKQPNAVCTATKASEISSTSTHLNTMLDALQSLNNPSWSHAFTSDPHFLSSKPDKDKELIIIPFRQYTIPMHNLHPSTTDCTHYCHTPYLWLPLWRSLRLSLDRMMNH